MDSTKQKQPHKRSNTDINYTEKMLRAIEKRKREIPLKVFRKKVIDHQNKINYQNEYDKIRSHLNSHSILAANTREYLIKRKAFFNSLGAKDIDRIE